MPAADRKIQMEPKYLSPDAKILVNLRDFPDAMVYEMERLFTVVDYLASMPTAERPFGIMFEESTGKFLPEEVGAWTAGKPGTLIVDTPVGDLFLPDPNVTVKQTMHQTNLSRQFSKEYFQLISLMVVSVVVVVFCLIHCPQ